ncbi:unnamed protein product [Cochlearia groenlandica]
MARINVYLHAFIFILTINIILQNIGYVQARPLTTKSTVANGFVSPAEPFEPPPSHGVETFRPTVPGHSPGIGHSVHI